MTYLPSAQFAHMSVTFSSHEIPYIQFCCTADWCVQLSTSECSNLRDYRFTGMAEANEHWGIGMTDPFMWILCHAPLYTVLF